MRRILSSGLPREVTVLAAVAFSVAVGFGVVAPAIPVFARSFGVGRTAAAAVISVFALMRLVTALLAGRFVNRSGERVVLATGIGIVAVSSALAGASQSYEQLLVLRGVGGIGSAMFTVSSISLLLRSVDADQRGRATGVYSGGFLLGGIFGPALGGVVTGANPRLPFFLYAGTLAVAGAIGLLALPRHVGETAAADTSTGEGDEADDGRPGSVRAALRLPAYRAALATQAANHWAVLGIRSALIPLFVAEALHLRPVWTGVGFVVLSGVNAVILLPAGRYADTRGRRPLLIAGTAVSAVAMVLLAVTPTLPSYLLAMALFGFGSGLLNVAPAAVVGDIAPGRAGTLVAAYQMAGDVGVIVGPLVAGRLADSAGYGAAFGVTAGVLGAATLLAIRMPETRRPGRTAHELAAADAGGIHE